MSKVTIETTENKIQKMKRYMQNKERKWIVGVDYFPHNTEHHKTVFPNQTMRVYFTVMAVTEEAAKARATAIYEDEFGETSSNICQQAIESTDALNVFDGDVAIKREFE